MLQSTKFTDQKTELLLCDLVAVPPSSIVTSRPRFGEQEGSKLWLLGNLRIYSPSIAASWKKWEKEMITNDG